MYSEIKIHGPSFFNGEEQIPLCPKCGRTMAQSGRVDTKKERANYYVCPNCLLKRGIRWENTPDKVSATVVFSSVDEKAKKAVEEILKRGNDVEIRKKKDGIQVIEVIKKIKYST